MYPRSCKYKIQLPRMERRGAFACTHTAAYTVLSSFLIITATALFKMPRALRLYIVLWSCHRQEAVLVRAPPLARHVFLYNLSSGFLAF
mmetsp:Transcript_34891/g.48564  ORF Transcript_34891/g.48564 Transcript_34891/m.48564 type:complete len:89 (-) Transcript_34891:188-454(-)